MMHIIWRGGAFAIATVAWTMGKSKKRPMFWIALLASTMAILASAAAAGATGPKITRFSFEDSYVDTETCPGIPIDTQLEGHVSLTVFSETRVEAHERLIYSGSANGKSFTDNESFTNFTNLDTGVQTFAGTAVNIQIPGYGNVMVDAGVVVADFSTDPPTIFHEGGHHPLLHQGYGPLCDYLSS